MSFSNKDISLKKHENGYVLKVNLDMNFDRAMDALRKDLIAHADILGESMVIGVQEYEFDSLQKGKIIELIGKYSNLSVKSLESIDIYKVVEKKRSEKKKSEKQAEKTKKKVFKDLERYKLKNQSEFEVSDFQISEEPVLSEDPVISGGAILEERITDSSEFPVFNKKDDTSDAKEVDTQLFAENMSTVFYRGTVRSGNTLQSQGHLVIIGDVNEGSELYAVGNIVVVGTLRGMAHAGCEGDESAFIMANKLLSNQIRISRHISIRTEEQSGAKNLKIAEIVDHNIVIK